MSALFDPTDNTRPASTGLTPIEEMRVMIVDDNPANVELLEQLLGSAGYTELVSTEDARAVAPLCESVNPDLVLLDLHMPGLTGIEVMRSIESWMQEPENLPVIVVTADSGRAALQDAFAQGARDFITKPIDGVELLLRIRTQLITRRMQLRYREGAAPGLSIDAVPSPAASIDADADLSAPTPLWDTDTDTDGNGDGDGGGSAAAVVSDSAELRVTRAESLALLAQAAEFGDDPTGQHAQRVGANAARIAAAMGCEDSFVARLREAAPLHDIGKLAVPERILLKPGPLSRVEHGRIMLHVEAGFRMLADSRSPVLQLAAEIARTHHEQWNGLGYVAGLIGEEIPLAGRIVAVADAFDALSHERPWRSAWTSLAARAEIDDQAGRRFDPAVVRAFLALDPATVVEPLLPPRLGLDG